MTDLKSGSTDSSIPINTRQTTTGDDMNMRQACSTSAEPAAVPEQTARHTIKRQKRRRLLTGALIVLIVAFMAAAGGFLFSRYENRMWQYGQAIDSAAQTAREALENTRELDGRFSLLARQLAGTQSHQRAFENFYQRFNRDREKWALMESEHALSTASEQLQLTGDVRLAVPVLKTVQSRLTSIDTARTHKVVQVITQDLGALNAVPHVNFMVLLAALDEALTQIDTLPFSGDKPAVSHPASATPTPTPTSTTGTNTNTMAVREAPAKPPTADEAPSSGWRAILAYARQALRNQSEKWVQITHLDHADTVHLTPDARYFIRENLRLRLLGMRLALLSRNAVLLRTEMDAAEKMAMRHFDLASSSVQALHASLARIREASANLSPPRLDATLQAVQQALHQSLSDSRS